ncbi:MAG: serine/threonine protein kinase [Candidatus Obscuribacterales bacterium]|nr:serine/threonine protein kinase [Candidatus Obscuribacterales bacterium]
MKLDEQLVGRTVDGILITGFIGAGGMGEAFRGVQKDLKRDVCIKFLKQAHLSDKETIYRFRREARALARLRHKHIISCYSVGVLDRVYPYIVTEFVTGKSLRQVLEDGPLEPGRAIRVVKELCEALSFIHDHGLIHRDVKPENIMLTNLDEKETVKLLDFGLVGKTSTNAFEGTLTDPSALIGTVNYMPPEAFMGKGAERGQDVYAVGCVLHELLTGEIPFFADNPIAVMHRHFNDALPPLPSKIFQHPGISSVLDAIVEKATAVDPKERFASCAEITELLNLLLENPSADHSDALLSAKRPAPASSAFFSKRMRFACVLLAGALMTISAFAVLKLQTTSKSAHEAHQVDKYDTSSLKILSSDYRKLSNTWTGKDSFTFEQTNQALIDTKRCIDMTLDLAKKYSPASSSLLTPAGAVELRSICASMAEVSEKAGHLVPLDLMKQAQCDLLASFGYFSQALSVLRDDELIRQFKDVHRYRSDDLRALHYFILSKPTGPSTEGDLRILRIAAPYYVILRSQPEYFARFLGRFGEIGATDDLVPRLAEIGELKKTARRSDNERLLTELVDIEVRSKRPAKAREMLTLYLKAHPQPNSLDVNEIRLGRQIAEYVSFETGIQWLRTISRQASRRQNTTAYCNAEIPIATVMLHHSGKDAAREYLHKIIQSSEFKHVILCSEGGLTPDASADTVMPLVRLLSETGDFQTCSKLMAQVVKTMRSKAEDMPESSDSAVNMRAAEDLLIDSLWNNGEREAARREIKAILARHHPRGSKMVSNRRLWPIRVASDTLMKDPRKSDAPKQDEDTSLSRRLKWSAWFRDRKQVNDTLSLCNETLKAAPQDFPDKIVQSGEWAVSSRVAESILQWALTEQQPIDTAVLNSLTHNLSVHLQRMLAAKRAWNLKDFDLFEAWLDLLRLVPSRDGTPGKDTTKILEEMLTRCQKHQHLARFLLLQRLIPAHADSKDLSKVRRIPGELAEARACVEAVSQTPSLAQFSSPLVQRLAWIETILHHVEEAKQTNVRLANDLLTQDRRIESAQAVVRASDCACADGRFRNALRSLERASALNFDSREFDCFIKAKLAWIYAKAGQPQELSSIVDYLMVDARLRRPQSVDEVKTTAELMYSTAYALSNNQKSVHHIELLLACTQNEPALHMGAYVMLANQLMLSKDYKKALSVVTGDLRPLITEKLLKGQYRESYDQYRELLGSIYQRLNRPQDAEVELKSSLNDRNSLWNRLRRLRKLADAQIDLGNLKEARANICLAKETLESLYAENDASTKRVEKPGTAIVLAVYSRLLRAEHKNTEADLFAGKAIALLKSESTKSVREEAVYVMRKLAKDFAPGTQTRQELDDIEEYLGKPYSLEPGKA